MASDDPIRASDADREVVVATLREAYTAGRLNLDEFDERTTAAYESKTWAICGADRRPALTADTRRRRPRPSLPVRPVAGREAAVASAQGLAAHAVPAAARQPDAVPDPAGRVDHPGDAQRLGERGGVVVALLVGTVVLMSAVRRR